MTHADRCAALDLRGTLAAGAALLEAAAVPSAALSAELLLMHALRRDRAWLYAHPESEPSAEEAAAYARLLERRAAGVPAQYLTGVQEFWGLEFEVTPAVLIPRPETEHLIEVALARLAARRIAGLRIADAGTGSGCLAVALAGELPNAQIVATDLSAAALEVAGRNARRHGAASRIRLMRTNLLEGVEAEGAAAPEGVSGGCWDLIVSNPPYVGTRDASILPREVREHEPREALFAGEEGFDLYAPLIAQAAALLRPRGAVVLEIGYNGSGYVSSLLGGREWRDVTITPDLAGIPRVVSAERAG